MSVEEAREALNDAIALWHQTRDRRDSAAIDVAEDRLILEVQATFPCRYFIAQWDGEGLLTVCRKVADPCPSCTARKQLTEVTA